MPDGIAPAPPPDPGSGPPQEKAPSPEARERRNAARERYRQSLEKSRLRKRVVNAIAGGIFLTLASGVVLSIVVVNMSSTQGARLSTRIEWERRRAELDARALEAARDGKLLPPESAPRE